MNYQTSSDGSKLGLEKIFDSLNIEFKRAELTESLGGDLPNLKLEFNCDKEFFSVNDLIKGELISSTGFKQKIHGFIYDFNFSNGVMSVQLMGCDPKFTRSREMTKYTSIDSAISSIYQLPRIDSVRTDLMNFDDPYYLYQKNLTNYHFCNKLCKSYKYNTLFGYRFDGILFVDLKEPKAVTKLTEGVEFKFTSQTNWTDYKLNQESVDDIEYTNSGGANDENHSYVQSYESAVSSHKAYQPLIKNYLFNQRLSQLGHLSNIKATSLLDLQVGDFVDIDCKYVIHKNSLVTSRTVYIEKGKIEVDYTLQSMK